LREGLLHQNERRKARETDDGTPGEGAAPLARPELTAPLTNYIDIVRHAAVRVALATAPNVALRLAVAHIIAGGMHWQVKAAPRNTDTKAVALATQTLAADATLEARREEAWQLLLPDAGRKRLAKLRTIALTGQREVSMRDVYARLVVLDDAEVMQLLAMVMAEALAVGTGMVDVVGAQLGIDVAQTWVPDAVLFDLVRDRAVLTALLADVAGSDVANCHLTTTGTKVRAVLRNAAAEKRGWLPRWFAFPQVGYTDRRLTQRSKAEA
jgi:ParB family chromosome partitioning protein